MGASDPSRRDRGSGQQAVLVVGAVVVLYIVLGYTVLPVLTVPFGCDGGDVAVDYAPQLTWDVAFDSQAAALTVTHAGGQTLPARHVDALLIRIEPANGSAETVYRWAESGGTFPIDPGDSVTVQDPLVDGRPVGSGDVVRVTWRGSWPDPQPNYCPFDHPTSGSATHTKVML